MSGWVFHAPFIDAHPGFNFYSVWERTKNNAVEKYPAVKTVRSLEEILNDPGVELVVVNTPNYTHYDYAKKALVAGKHVLVEKPFTVTVSEAKELIRLASDKNVTLTVYHNRRFDSDYRTIRKVVEQRLLGEIVEAEFHYDRYKEDISPKVHKETPGPGTGALYDLGSHLVDQALQLFGMPDAVFADIQIMREVSKVDDYFELLLMYKKLRVRLKAGYLVREALPGYVLHGTKGSFIKAKTDVQENDLLSNIKPGTAGWGVEPDSQKGLLHTEINGEVVKKYIDSETGNYLDFYEGLYQTVREGKTAPVEATDALNVIRIIEAAFQSNIEKRVVNFEGYA
jgi:predicted dehydrogenase